MARADTAKSLSARRLTAPISGRLLSIREIADYTGFGLHSVLTWIRNGELKAMNLARTVASKRPTWRVRPEDLEVFLMIRTNGPRMAKARRQRRPPDDVILFYK